MSQPLMRKKAGRAEGGSVWDGAVEGGEGEAGRGLSVPSLTLVPSVQLRISFHLYKGGLSTYLANASSQFYITFTCNSPNENRSCEESN